MLQKSALMNSSTRRARLRMTRVLPTAGSSCAGYHIMLLARAFQRGGLSLQQIPQSLKKMSGVKRGRSIDDSADASLLQEGFALHVLSQPPVLMCMMAQLIDIEDRSRFARACKAFYSMLRKHNAPLNLMCSLWAASHWIPQLERERIIAQSGQLECYKHSWHIGHTVGVRCSRLHHIELVAKSGHMDVILYAIDQFDQVDSDAMEWRRFFKICTESVIHRISDKEMCALMADGVWNNNRLHSYIMPHTWMDHAMNSIVAGHTRARDRFLGFISPDSTIDNVTQMQLRFSATASALEIVVERNDMVAVDRIWSEMIEAAESDSDHLKKSIALIIRNTWRNLPESVSALFIRDRSIRPPTMGDYCKFYHQHLACPDDEAQESVWTKIDEFYASLL